jgi:hypothetical protein
MKIKTIGLLLFLILLNFGIQSFNFLNGSFCDFYTFHADCSGVMDVVLNKLIRLILNIIMIGIISEKKWSDLKDIKLYLPIAILSLFIFDLFIFFLADAGRLIVVHKVLNPLLYSPLIIIALAAFMFVNKPNIDK